MSVEIWNFEFRYNNAKGKPVFSPTERGREIGFDLKAKVESAVEFDPVFFHLAKGGHVAALHAHRKNAYFARVDLKNFFYTIGRNRVERTLRDAGLGRSRHFAKWSTVKNPYDQPTYSLPYGFVQSPILATLVMQSSALGQFVIESAKRVTATVYLDDIAISGNDLALLEDIYSALKGKIEESGFTLNESKSAGPTDRLELFNCEIEYARSAVLNSRREEFYSAQHGPESAAAFERYCDVVELGNLAAQ